MRTMRKSSLFRRFRPSYSAEPSSRGGWNEQVLCKACRRLDIKRLVAGVEDDDGRHLQLRKPVSSCPLCQLSVQVYNEIFARDRTDRDSLLFDDGLASLLAVVDLEHDEIAKLEKWETHFSITPSKDYLGPYLLIKWYGMRRTEVRLRPLEVANADFPTGLPEETTSPRLHPEHQADMKLIPRTFVQGSRVKHKTVRDWLWRCRTLDYDYCRWNFQNPVLGQPYRDPINILLIDVDQERLVEGSSDLGYMALSYVWGQARTLQTQKDNLSDLMEPGALSHRNTDIALTIRDAIKFVRNMKECGYLWVDCLCIIQDDEFQKHTQISHMDIIYSHAYMTIVAASGKDASYGLPGVRRYSRNIDAPTAIVLDNIPFGFIHSPSTFKSSLTNAQISTRSWTFQERYLSPRCLYFFPEQAFFACSSVLMAEGFGLPEIEF